MTSYQIRGKETPADTVYEGKNTILPTFTSFFIRFLKTLQDQKRAAAIKFELPRHSYTPKKLQNSSKP
jgi:hypothetical protein